MLAAGNVQAGIDMTLIKDKDIIINGDSVKITLPPATIISVELLPDQSEVFDSQKKWLLSDYEGLEVEAMDKARQQLETWATHQANILPTAEKLASLQLETFLRQVGFNKIEITIKQKNDTSTTP